MRFHTLKKDFSLMKSKKLAKPFKKKRKWPFNWKTNYIYWVGSVFSGEAQILANRLFLNWAKTFNVNRLILNLINDISHSGINDYLKMIRDWILPSNLMSKN